MTGRHRTVKISFLTVGHTKFAPDMFFGTTKRRYRRSTVYSLDDFVEDIKSHCGKSIIPFLVANEKGDLNAPIYDWQRFYRSKASRLPGIKDFYHFEATSERRGVMLAKKEIAAEMLEFHIFDEHTVFEPTELPEPLDVLGIPVERQKYLYEKLREYVSDEWKDVLCPKPLVPAESTDGAENTGPNAPIAIRPISSDQEEPGEPAHTVKEKRMYKCGYCKQFGDQNRVLKNNTYSCPQRQHDVHGDDP